MRLFCHASTIPLNVSTYRNRYCKFRSSVFRRGNEHQRWLPKRELTNFATWRVPAGLSGTDLAHFNHMKFEPSETIALNAIAKETREMNAVALLTSTYGRDLELCTLLCESVDRHVGSFSKHVLLVPDSDLPLFAHLQSERRSVIPVSTYLPKWLWPLPRMVQRQRQFWWSFRTRPVSGRQVQQLLKIAAALLLPYQRYCILDPDLVFFRDFDLSRFETPNPIPLLSTPDEVTPSQPRRSRRVETTHKLLGLPPLPASDFTGPIVFWDRQTAHAMVSQIEAVSNRHWIEALCRASEFSETMLYGYFAQSDARFSGAHRLTSSTHCVRHWEQPKPGNNALSELLSGAAKDDVAFSMACLPGMPLQTIRAAIEQNAAVPVPHIVAKETARLDALC
jgi:hypothetical protein